MNNHNQVICDLMGKMVQVVVDRPIGSCHNDLFYPINYGYIPGVLGGDGEEQDVYILGVSEPLSNFCGRVIGAVLRHNDCEDKLIVAPDGMYFHQGQIAEAVNFQEQFFSSHIDSLLRKSCGVIPVRKNGDKYEFLVLLQRNGCWSFPKGHMEPGESEQQTALRELHEESGLTAELIPGASIVYEYNVSMLTRKQVVLFLGKSSGNVILQTSEAMQYRWVQAEELQTYLHPDTYTECRKLLHI